MIKENILRINEQIWRVCSKVNRDPKEVSIVTVSKGRSPQEIKEAVLAGITDIGENRVQEAIAKYNELRPNTYDLRPIKWHMVGHLQTNKVKEAVQIFALIQSVDSLHLAAEIDKQAAKINKIQDILIEIKTSKEATKFGLKSDEAIEVIKEIVRLKNVNIKGLMTIAPLVDNPEKARPYFRMLRELRDKFSQYSVLSAPYSVLSMGMTDDFEVAIEEGSNMVRLGRAIFEG
jgi:pyridoxal phosphate enzyme (YggS family)